MPGSGMAKAQILANLDLPDIHGDISNSAVMEADPLHNIGPYNRNKCNSFFNMIIVRFIKIIMHKKPEPLALKFGASPMNHYYRT